MGAGGTRKQPRGQIARGRSPEACAWVRGEACAPASVGLWASSAPVHERRACPPTRRHPRILLGPTAGRRAFGCTTFSEPYLSRRLLTFGALSPRRRRLAAAHHVQGLATPDPALSNAGACQEYAGSSCCTAATANKYGVRSARARGTGSAWGACHHASQAGVECAPHVDGSVQGSARALGARCLEPGLLNVAAGPGSWRWVVLPVHT